VIKIQVNKRVKLGFIIKTKQVKVKSIYLLTKSALIKKGNVQMGDFSASHSALFSAIQKKKF